LNSGIYTLASALIAQEQRVAATSQNLANVASDGYKVVVRSIAGARAKGAAAASSDPLLGAVNAAVQIRAAGIEEEQGRLAETYESYDVGIDGPGYIAVQTPAGTAFTRAGHLASRGGQLVTRDEGYPVLGASGPIRLAGPDIDIAADGSVSSGGAAAGKIRVEIFDPADLSPMGASLFAAAKPGRPAPSSTRLFEGRIEESTVRPLQEVTSLIESQRSFELYQKALGITLNDVDRQAVTELGSVT
jgi:flagellar basal-body rod protein FlgF